MNHLTQDDLDAVTDELNYRPRKVLDCDTPANKLRSLLHSAIKFTATLLGTRSPF